MRLKILQWWQSWNATAPVRRLTLSHKRCRYRQSINCNLGFFTKRKKNPQLTEPQGCNTLTDLFVKYHQAKYKTAYPLLSFFFFLVVIVIIIVLRRPFLSCGNKLQSDDWMVVVDSTHGTSLYSAHMGRSITQYSHSHSLRFVLIQLYFLYSLQSRLAVDKYTSNHIHLHTDTKTGLGTSMPTYIVILSI